MKFSSNKAKGFIAFISSTLVLCFAILTLASLNNKSFSWFSFTDNVGGGGAEIECAKGYSASIESYKVGSVASGVYTLATDEESGDLVESFVLDTYNPMNSSSKNASLVLKLTVNAGSSQGNAVFKIRRKTELIPVEDPTTHVATDKQSIYTEEPENWFSNVVKITYAQAGGTVNTFTKASGAESKLLINGMTALYENEVCTLNITGEAQTFYFIIEYNLDFLERLSVQLDEITENTNLSDEATYTSDIFFTLN